MKHPEQIVSLAEAAMKLERQEADAAALLIDAAAMLASEVNVPIGDLAERLQNSHATLAEAKRAVEALGPAAARRQ